ncbi:MAG: TylF/MycF/NovP-related O-methyltransferase [Promethearchaeota archaeon]
MQQRKIIYSTFKTFIIYPPYRKSIHKNLISLDDPVRYTTIALTRSRIRKEKIEGSFAEVGVYRGDTSEVIHYLAPNKKLYLFDTFEGFPRDLTDDEDKRFKNTCIDLIEKKLGNLENVYIKKGIFPETAKGLEKELFSLVIIDLDIYQSTLDALEFFYPRLSSGGYLFIHDYNNPLESNAGVFKAVNEFKKKIKERIIELPDKWGSVIIRKM